MKSVYFPETVVLCSHAPGSAAGVPDTSCTFLLLSSKSPFSNNVGIPGIWIYSSLSLKRSSKANSGVSLRQERAQIIIPLSAVNFPYSLSPSTGFKYLTYSSRTGSVA